jgi:hypothetical protein
MDTSTDIGLDGRCSIPIASISALRPTQPSIQWVSWALSLGMKQPGREAGPSASNAEVKNGAATFSWRGD